MRVWRASRDQSEGWVLEVDSRVNSEVILRSILDPILRNLRKPHKLASYGRG